MSGHRSRSILSSHEEATEVETSKPQRLEPLSVRYLMIVPIPFYVDERGQVWLEEGWHRDFVEHLEYLPRLTLAAPLLMIGAR